MDAERRLIRQVQAGDRQAADTLVRSYYDEVFRLVARQTSDRATAQDLTQEALISMLRTIGSFDSRKAGFRTWLHRIATNKVIDWYRSRSSRFTQTLCLDEIEPVDETDIARQVEQAEFSRRVQVFVGQFPALTQEIFRLRVFAGFSFVEIAAQVQASDNTVKTQYYRLLAQLRKEFADEV